MYYIFTNSRPLVCACSFFKVFTVLKAKFFAFVFKGSVTIVKISSVVNGVEWKFLFLTKKDSFKEIYEALSF